MDVVAQQRGVAANVAVAVLQAKLSVHAGSGRADNAFRVSRSISKPIYHTKYLFS